MSAEHEGPAGGRKPEGTPKGADKPRAGSSLTDAVVAALAKVETKQAAAEATPAEPAPAEPAPAEPAPAEPASAEPAPAEPAPVEPAPAEPAHAEPAHAEPAHAEPAHAEPAPAEPTHAEPAPAEPAHAEPPRAEQAVSSEPAPAEAGCAATAQAPKEPPPRVVEPAPVADHPAPNGFRRGAGSFADLAQRSASRPHTGPAAAPEPAPSAPSDPNEALAPVDTGPIEVTYFGRTDVGLVREHNEDNFLVADLTTRTRGAATPQKIEIGERGCIFAVCDGMGGAAAGEVASQMAVDTILEYFDRGDPPADRDEFARRLVRSIEDAGHRIFSAAKMDRSRRGMGTTATLAGLVDSTLFVGQVGDSRAYILRNQQLELITKDQSLVNQLIEAGQLTEEEAEAFEHSNIILQALGTTEEVTVDLTFLELRPGDRLLLCSDGLSGLVHADMIKEAMQSTPNLVEVADKLIQMANAGGGHDNITVILADFAGEGLLAPVDARPLYQQYPLPPEAPAPEHDAAPRETRMKAGAAKPGADVKRDELLGDEEIIVSTRSGKPWLLLVGLVGLLFLLGGAWWILGPALLDSAPDDAAGEQVPESRPPEVVPPPAPPTTTEVEVEPAPAPARAETGTVRVTTDVEDGTLFVNGEARGPLVDGQVLELAPGAYVIEARSGDARIADQTVTVVEGEELGVTLHVPALPPEPAAVVEPAPTKAPQKHRPRPTRDRPADPAPRPRGGSSELPSNPF